uniref:Uncharacterized protein n=1 Tax=Aegilops tauschii subsp. strangulata TaxID=200361 RepID=A0A453PV78_AEGTS
MQTISQLSALSIPSSAEAASSIIGGSLYIQLYNVLQTNLLQREQILHAMKQLYISDSISPVRMHSLSRSPSPSSALSVDRSMLEAAQEKEKELVNEVLELQWRLLCAQDEVQRLKAKAAQVPTFHRIRDLVSGHNICMFTLRCSYLTDLMSECCWGCC